MIVRPIVEASFGAFVVLGGVVNGATELVNEIVQESSITPQVILGTDALVNWGLVIVGGTLIWRAATNMRGIQEAQRHADDNLRNALKDHTNAVQAMEERIKYNMLILEKRIEDHDRKWRLWEPMMIEMAHRYGIKSKEGA